ncbi:MAG TPA: thioredoxin domain-containing protein, partial [Nakamurella sp.]|nr:thioredoxin domain-containing protein [Nakamurella sp.]
MTNRLADAASVYLRQHADNPVDWWPWGDQAFAEARRRDVPVLLSVGYASCHWCHVMAHESFEDAGIAEFINTNFVPIKVDREERPDVDAVYMSATQALTGQGGWPMTCFLTPDGEPFYAGTYFPPEPRSGLPSFRQVLTAVADTWRRERSEVAAAAGRITTALRDNMAPLPESPIDPAQLDRARDALLAQTDRSNGGFGRAPKFPPSMVAEFLLRNHERTGSAAALDAVTLTLERMARGGIYDQLAGGFARYSVDATWHVPHFEKMLDDNALLLRLYAHHARLTGSPLSHRIAGETGDFLLRELRTERGCFAASLDADTAGVEGLTYRWPVTELQQLLGGDDAARALPLFGVDPDRPDPEGEVLRLVRDPDDAEWFAGVRARLLAARDGRPQPGLDAIVVLRSNGLAIGALAEAGVALGRPEWVTAADAAADALVDLHRVDGGWLRSSLDGDPGTGAATLADVACFAAGLLALYQA